jgi:hypothetical protein
MNYIDQSAENFHIFINAMGRRYLNTPANSDAIVSVVEKIVDAGGVVTLADYQAAWLGLSNDGLLQEPLSEAEEKEAAEQRTIERNKRLEAQDRRSGATFVDSEGRVRTAHLSDQEKEELRSKAEAESKEEYKKALAWIKDRAKQSSGPAELGPSPIDAQNSIQAILAPVTISNATVETKKAIVKWMRNTPSQHVVIARRNNPDAATKMDKILLKSFEADL